MMKTPVIRKNTYIGIAMFMCVIVLAFMCSSVKCFAGSNIPVTVDIPLQYVVNNQTGLQKAGKNINVTFTLQADNEFTPMPDGKMGGEKSVTLTHSGKTSFGPITYERPDVYEYMVIRNTSGAKVNGLKVDTTKYRVSVCALNDGSGSIIIKKLGHDGKSELIYGDTFKSNTGAKTGDETPLLYYVNIILVAMLLLMFVWTREERKKWEKESRKTQ